MGTVAPTSPKILPPPDATTTPPPKKKLDAGALFVLKSRGSWLHCGYHLTTAIVAPALLSLPFALALLGWEGGVLVLALAGIITFYSYNLLSLVLEHHAELGHRQLRFRDMAHDILGPRWGRYYVGPLQLGSCYGAVIACTLLGGQSLKFIYLLARPDGSMQLSHFIVIFGGFTLILAQIPSFHSLRHINLVSLMLCFAYCACTTAGAIYIGNSNKAPPKNYSLTGVGINRVFGFFNAISIICTTYGNGIIPEIQATIAEPVKGKMFKGLLVCYVVVISNYFSVGISGYWAFGNQVDSSVLQNFMVGSNPLLPKWFLLMTNGFTVLQVAACALVLSSGGMVAVAVEPLLQKCASLSHIKQLQAHLITTGVLQFHPFPRSKFLEFCATSSVSGSLLYAVDIFRHIAFPITNDWNAVIRGLAQSHQPTDAVIFYRQGLRVLMCKPDALTCSFTLKACARALACNEAHQIHSQVVRYGFIADVLLQTTLLDVYAKSGLLNKASQLFDEMSERDVTCWNAIIAGLAQGNQPGEALQLFKSMKDLGFKPNEITVLGALSACAQLGVVQEGENVYNYIKDQNLDTNEQVCNVVIDMFGKCGYVGKAYRVFNHMRCTKTLVTWNTMIMVLGTNGEGADALKLFKQMSKEGLQPDNVSYLACLCACNHAGMVDDGVELFETMIKDGSLIPNIKHYGTMVDLLGRSGRLNEAYNIINSIPITPDVVLWQTLLGACKTYGNIEMAEKASRKLMEMGSSSDGDFVSLSNIYAAHQRWKDVGRVRDAMKNKEVIKVPGFSYIDVNGVIHKFVNGDKTHLNMQEIYTKLEEIMSRVREHGYVPETGYVLHDIGPEEKENALSYHSEKLAVAFGLVKIDDKNSSIRVNKNLRICGDCHEVMKLVSKVYEREIIVRDRTRFHRFKAGSCTCKDFW